MNIPGRTCPLDYDIEREVFESEIPTAVVLYVVGGLYGNKFALDEIEKMKLEEESSVSIIYNGDIHWFDKDIATFKYIESFVTTALLGNVEAEILRKEDLQVGCGCSYPSCVSDVVVKRSNEIHRLLKNSVEKDEEILNSFSKRKKAMIVSVGDKKIFITHGDEKSLAGWGLSREELSDLDRQKELVNWFSEHKIDIIACTHTCSPAMLKLDSKVVINNGASGMPNYKNRLSGNIIRISKIKSNRAICRTKIDDIYVELVAVNYDTDAFLNWFDNLWDKKSPASLSYRTRIIKGTKDEIKDSIINGFEICK